MEERNTVSTEELVKMVEDIHSLYFKLEEKFDDQKEHLKCLYEKVDRLAAQVDVECGDVKTTWSQIRELRDYIKDIDFYLTTRFKDFRHCLYFLKKRSEDSASLRL